MISRTINLDKKEVIKL